MVHQDKSIGRRGYRGRFEEFRGQAGSDTQIQIGEGVGGTSAMAIRALGSNIMPIPFTGEMINARIKTEGLISEAGR